jgi:hypothetical protein
MREIMHIKTVYSNFRNFNLIKNSFKLTWNTHRSNYSTVSKYKKEGMALFIVIKSSSLMYIYIYFYNRVRRIDPQNQIIRCDCSC